MEDYRFLQYRFQQCMFKWVWKNTFDQREIYKIPNWVNKHIHTFVQQIIYPILVHPNYTQQFSDQFAFWPTGSTTGALTQLLHTLTDMLQTEPYVHVIALDFSKAFDTVRHPDSLCQILRSTHSRLYQCTYNWLLEYFSKRRHCTRVMDIISGFLVINASIVQGSSIGPVSYVINASDLCTICLNEQIVQIRRWRVPSRACIQIRYYWVWAAIHCQLVRIQQSDPEHQKKTKSKNANLPPPPVTGIHRVSQMVVLGVTIHDRLSFKPHIENLISRCAQTFYALRVLKSKGLNGIALWDVGQAILINRLLYASPVWWGFTDASDKQRLQAVITRAQSLHPCHHYRNSVGKLMTLSSLALFVTNIMCCMVSSHL